MWILLMYCVALSKVISSSEIFSNSSVSYRTKRALAFDLDQRRITFPPGSTFLLTPTLAIPFIRNLPKGFGSDMTISAPFSMSMDELGLADEANPWGLIPGLSLSRAESRHYQSHVHRYRRSPVDYKPHPLGDRKVLFEMIEHYLYSLGHDGSACLRRAICEFHEHPLPYYGLFGEMLATILSVSSAPFAEEILPEYVHAERAGKESRVCHQYFKNCSLSMFSQPGKDRYLRHNQEDSTASHTVRAARSS